MPATTFILSLFIRLLTYFFFFNKHLFSAYFPHSTLLIIVGRLGKKNVRSLWQSPIPFCKMSDSLSSPVWLSKSFLSLCEFTLYLTCFAFISHYLEDLPPSLYFEQSRFSLEAFSIPCCLSLVPTSYIFSSWVVIYNNGTLSYVTLATSSGKMNWDTGRFSIRLQWAA